MRSRLVCPVFIALSAVGLAFVACGDEGPRRPGNAVDVERVRGMTVVRSAGEGRWGGDTVRARVGLVIGAEDGGAGPAFGRVSGIAVDAGGRIYVADEMASTVRVFAPDGTPLATLGREGDGPGELRRPTGPVVGPGGVLYVRDETRVSTFRPAAPGAPALVPGPTFPGPALPYSLAPTRIDGAGRLFYPVSRTSAGRTRHAYLVFDERGERVDSVAPPEYPRAPAAFAFARTGPPGGRRVDGVTHVPFAPLPSWDVTSGGTLVSGDARTFVFHEIALRGDTLRRVERVKAPRPIPARELRDSAAALRARLDSLPVPLSRLVGVPPEVRQRRLPTRYPSYVRLHAAHDGTVWVEEWPLAGDRARTPYDVFAADGALLGTVLVPLALAREPAPFFTGRAVYGVAEDPATGVQRVVRLDVELPAAR